MTIFAILVIILACTHNEDWLPPLYGGLGITFFYCAYLFIRFDFKKIRLACKNAKGKLSQKSKLLNKLFNDIYFRTILGTCLSLFLGICFVVYNAFAGIYYHSVWNGSISVYYGLLVVIKISFLYGEFSLVKKGLSQEETEFKRAKMFRLEGVLLLLVNIALICPITLLALSKKEVNLPVWVAIASACYTFYKMIVCTHSFIKTRRQDNLSIKGLKNLNLMGALVTLLSLENTMIITFSEGEMEGMKILMIISSLIVMVLLLTLATLTFIKGKKEVNKLQSLSQTKTLHD